MRIRSKRLTELRHKYVPRAKASRLRLSEKTIRVLERKRIREGRTFEAVYRQERKRRVNNSAARIAKSYGISFKQAKIVRREALSFGLKYAELLPRAKEFKKQEEEGPPGLPITTNWLEFTNNVMNIREAIAKGKASRDFFVDVSFGDLEYQGPIGGLVLQDFKEHGDEEYSEDTVAYWVLDSTLVTIVAVPDVSMHVVIGVDRGEEVDGEPEWRKAHGLKRLQVIRSAKNAS